MRMGGSERVSEDLKSFEEVLSWMFLCPEPLTNKSQSASMYDEMDEKGIEFFGGHERSYAIVRAARALQGQRQKQ